MIRDARIAIHQPLTVIIMTGMTHSIARTAISGLKANAKARHVIIVPIAQRIRYYSLSN